LTQLKAWFYLKFDAGIWTVKSKQRNGEDIVFTKSDAVFEKFELLIKIIFAKIEEEKNAGE
jgi:hypothetical protein